jgi:hypothetical protein
MTSDELVNQEEEQIEEEEQQEEEEATVETDIVVDDTTLSTVDTPIYEFEFTERSIPDYTIAKCISQWLVQNLSALVDDNDSTVFGKVNTGFNEQSLKSFGKKPVCDIYINRVEYNGDFDYHPPVKVHTILLFYLKGANNYTYGKACELHDIILQGFLENESWRRLEGIVRDTTIHNSELRVQPLNKKWGVMGAFELTHHLY